MSFKEKLAKYYTKTYMKKYGDRITQVQGNVISVKVTEKSVLWVFHKLLVTIIVKPDRSRNVLKCVYKKNKWFKKPEFMPVYQGNLLIVQGLKSKKGKENKEFVQIINIRNLTTKKDLVPVEGKVQQVRKIQRIK